MWLSEDIRDHEYHERPSVSWSQLKAFIRSPRHFKAQFERPKKKTPEMEYGSLLHLLSLQPAEYLRRVMEDNKADRRTKDGKAEYAAFLESLQEDTILMTHRYSVSDTRELIGERCKHGHVFKAEVLAEAFEMRNELWKHPQFVETFVESCDPANNIIQWKPGIVVEQGGEIELDGITWRFKPDLRSRELATIWDYKTTDSVDDEAVIRTITRQGYHYNAAFYSMLASAIDGIAYDNFTWVFQERDYPYVVRFVKLPDEQLYYCRTQVRELIERFVQTSAFDDWSVTYPAKTLEVKLPEWAFRMGDSF